MKARHFSLIALGALLAVTAGVLAQSGGYPTRARFNSIGVNAAPPAGNGSATLSGTLTAGASTIGGVANTDYVRLSQNNTFVNAISGSSQRITGEGGAILDLMDSSGPNNGRRTILAVDDGNHFYVQSLSDAGSSIENLIDATLNTSSQWTSLALAADTITVNGVASSDFARLSQANVFTGAGIRNQINSTTSAAGTDYSAWRTHVDSAGTPTSTFFFTANNGATAGFGCASGECGGLFSDAVQTVVTANSANDVLSITSDAIAFDAVDLTPTSGTFTVNYDNCCTTTITQSVRWYKIGSVVTLTAAAATAGTGDTTTFDSTVDVPAAIRPTTSNAYSAGYGANNNGTSVTAMVELSTTGEIIVNRCGAVTGTCDGGAWTGSGARGLDAWTLSYVR